MSALASCVEIEPGYTIHPIIQGGWQLADGHRLERRATSLDEAGWIELLAQRALDGRTTFDCADIYTGVEELLGKVRLRILELGGDEPQIHTKCVPDLARLGSLRRADVEQTVDRSLRRLGVERLDLVQFHWWDLAIPGYVEAAGWLDELRRAGKIRLLGATNFPTAALREILEAGVPVRTHQVQYSLLDRRPAGAMTELCRRYDVHLLCYGSIAGGLLSSRFLRDGLPTTPRNRSEIKYRLVIEEAGGWDRVADLLRAVEDLAPRAAPTGTSPSDRVAPLAMRWVLEQPRVAAVILGASPRRDVRLTDLESVRAGGLDELRALPDEAVRSMPGDVYELERDRDGRHGRIMRYDLQEDETS